MKRLSTCLPRSPAAILAVAILCLMAFRAGAQSRETSWTSVDGVPLGRLTPESVAKAGRFFDLPATVSTAPCPKTIATAGPATAGGWIPVAVVDAPEGSEDPDAGVLPEKGELPAPPLPSEPSVESGAKIRLEGRLAIAPSDAPSVVQSAIDAGNRLQDKFYKWGGGRARLEDNGYDCSGSVSYVLIKSGLLRSPLTSGSFMRNGESGPGRWITIYARNGHVFMTLCGLRLDTGGHAGYHESGPRWCPNSRGISGFVMRHPPGF